MNADEIFLAAVEKTTPAERAAYLDGACGHDPELRAKVEGLLQSHEQAGSFLQQPLFENLATVSQPLSESPGTVIGPYKLLQQIGEGGMGVVYMAEQSEPVERRVALKIIKPGMDTRQIIARFEAERQALAMMDHPNIARVLDAGTTASGRPYFVMELVRGVPITDYCDEHHLTPQERLRLFLPVCHAVQHAHLKGIIHRDLKPTNVLVAEYDDHPVPKVIDFGVAKATSRLTEKTMFTQFGQIVGTIEYMSPEQARFNELDIDTRSDVYSLGVLLYELLTGATPFDRDRLRSAAFDEVLRILREEDPPRPSLRLITAETRASVAALRKMEPQKLSTLVRGELDWIVMKALEKDRGRRYETANALAADIHNYLTDAAVLACPPSRGYRFRKFASRNKVALATGAMVAAALVAGIIGTTWQAIRATHEATRATNAEGLAEERYEAEKTAREQADAARASESEQRQIAQDETKRAEENFDKARRAVDEYLSQVTESELLTVPGLQPLREDLLRAALTFYAEFTQERADDPTIQRELATAHYRLARIHAELGDDVAAAEANNEAIRLYEKLRDEGQFDREMQVSLARAYFSAVRYDDTVTLCQEVLEAEPGHAEARSLLANTWNNLGNAVDYEDVGAALTYHRQAFELRESLVRDAPENTRYLAELGGTVNNLGNLLYKQRKFAEALAMYERAVQYTQQAYEREPHSLVWGRWLGVCVINVARTQAALGQEQRALAAYERYVAVTRKRVFENPAVMSLRGDHYGSLLSLGRYQQHLNMTAEAARSFREAREVLENIPRETADQLYDLATVYAALAQPDDGALEPGEDELAERQRSIEQTLQTLRQAVEAGFSDSRKLRSERQFDVIRNRDEFRQLIASMETAAEVQRLLAGPEGGTGPSLADQQNAAEMLSGVIRGQPGTLRHSRTLAATLHSIGMIQTGLKQFEDAEQSFRQALDVWDTIRQTMPDKRESELDWLGTQIALGRLYWDMGRHREAHFLWTNLRPQLEELQASHSEGDPVTSGPRLSELVRPICRAYGDFGLLQESATWLAASGPESKAEILRWDATVRLLLNDEAGYRTRCAQLVEQSTRTPSTHDLHCIATACLLAPEGYGDLDRWLRASQECAELRPDWTWAPFYIGIAHYRAGRYDDALNALQSKHDWFMAWPLLAMTCQRLGAQTEADAWFDRTHDWYLRSIQTTPFGNTTVLMGGLNDWDRAQFQLLYREARSLVTGTTRSDPWQHLIEARGYRLIGEKELADRELAASVAAAPNDARLWTARARLLTEWGDPERSLEVEWQSAVELAGEDPFPWIHRGRWYAERGAQEKADADFARAASLTPQELNRFVEAGWWVVGPYPSALNEFCPPEIDPDPSRPVYIIDPMTGLSDEPVNWESAATNQWGRVELGSLPVRQEGGSVYALAHVYSPAEQTKLLMIHKSQPLRVWINGDLISDYTAGSESVVPFYDTYHRVPVVLRPGRNAILVKSQTADFTLRIGDTPQDRAVLLAEQERFTEAFAAFHEMSDADRDEPSAAMSYTLRRLVSLLGTDEEYADLCRTLIVVAQCGNAHTRLSAASLCAYRPNPVLDEHAGALVTYVEESLAQEQSDWAAHSAALVHFRAGNRERSLALLNQSSKRNWYGLPLQTVLAQQGGDPASARNLFDQALSVATEYETSLKEHDRTAFYGKNHFFWWYDWAGYLTMLREAELTVRGETAQSDAVRVRCESISNATWVASPETDVFDHTVLFGSIDGAGQPKFPQPYIARGRRLADLGRFDAAEADFNKAVELGPNDADVLAVRAAFLADLGRPDEAASDFHAALNLLDQSAEKPRWQWGVPIDLAVADRADVFERLVALRPQDPRPLMTRMAVRMQRGDLEGSCSDAERLATYAWAQPDWCQAEALWRGDRDEFDRLRAAVQRGSDPFLNILHLGLAPTEEPLTAELLQEAERMWREQPQDRWRRRCIGLAQMRAGKYSEAVGNLKASLLPGDRWQQDSVVWPLLAVAEHHLGDTAAARRWLNVTQQWLELRNSAEFRKTGSATGVGTILPQDVMTAMASYREARALIDGPDAADAERDRLAARAPEWNEAVRARDDGRRQRTLARVEADWQRLVDGAGNDPAPWIRRADWYTGRGEPAKAEADWQRAVELEPDDPSLWIQRGHWYAEQAETQKADADYAHAASLTPHELNRFLEPGWWVVGPYSTELQEFCPPEVEPDPSRPLHVIDRQSGISNEPTGWRSVPSGAHGTVDISAVISVPEMSSVYSLAHVWSPDERSVLLMLGKRVPLRVWVNGALIEDFTPGEYPEQPGYEQFHRIPVVLREGRNTILVKSPSAGFTLRIGDTPRDRALLLAEQRRYTEALSTLDELPFSADDLESGFLPWGLVPVLTMHDSPQTLYQQHCAAALARLAEANREEWLRYRISWVCSQRQNRLFDEHAARIVSLAEEHADEHPEAWTRPNVALVNYRAGRYEQALSQLTSSDLAHPFSLPLQALLHHQLGNVPAAEKLLELAFSAGAELADRLQTVDRSDFAAPTWGCWWSEWSAFLGLLAEAEQETRGETTAADQLRAVAEATQVRRWTESPELVAFDHAVLFTALGPDGHLKYPQPLVARGHRLAELGRFDAAEADFNKAVELAPDDVDVLLTRARFLADRDDVERAAAEFSAALKLKLGPSDESYVHGLQIGRELANHEAVFSRVAEQLPDDYRIWLGRGMWHADHARWQQAADDYSRANWPEMFFVLRTMEQGCLQCLAGDLDGYRQTCQGLIDVELSGEQMTFLVRRGIVVLCGIALEEGPLPPSELLRLAEQLNGKPNDRWVRLGTALALYRAGRFDDALSHCEEDVSGTALLDQRLALHCLRAMCLHQMGKSAEARQLLQVVNAFLPAVPAGTQTAAAFSKLGAPEETMRIVFWALHAQATRLIESGTPEPGPAVGEEITSPGPRGSSDDGPVSKETRD